MEKNNDEAKKKRKNCKTRNWALNWRKRKSESWNDETKLERQNERRNEEWRTWKEVEKGKKKRKKRKNVEAYLSEQMF